MLLALAVGVLYACAVYMLLQRSLVRLVIGLALLSHGANLLIFAAGGLTRGRPPLAPAVGPVADPLPQALVLTAIVISFAVMAFAIVLARRTHDWTQTDDLATLRRSDS